MPKIKSLSLIASIAFVLAQPAYAQEPLSQMARIESIQSSDRGGLDGLTLEQMMKKFGVPGLSVAVVKDFQIHWAKTYGVADVETNQALDVDTLFQAASISKPVTAMAAIKLMQDQRLSLDKDVNTLLKSWKVPASALTRVQPVTPRSLFSHTSGADDGFGFPGYGLADVLPDPVQIVRGDKPSNVGSITFNRSPYQRMKYSGGGIQIMQVALTDVTGQNFSEFMQATVLDPLRMTNSSFQQPPRADWTSRLARAHNQHGLRMGDPWRLYPEQAAGRLWSRASDLARFMIEVQTAVRGPGGKLLTQQGAQEMTSPVGIGDFSVGLQVERRGQGWYVLHDGSNWGFQCALLGHLRKGYGVVIMTNGDGGAPLIREIQDRVAHAYGWDSLDTPSVR